MNAAHFHLLVNHLPIIFPIVGILVMISALISKSEPVKRTAYLIFIVGSLTAIVAMTSGEGAEEVVEKINGVTKNSIESHEEAAEIFAILAYILGGLSIVGLWANYKQRTFSNTISTITLIFAIVVMLFAKQTGTTGGEIRHTEIVNTNNITTQPNSDFNKESD